jgi:hypothetical protein
MNTIRVAQFVRRKDLFKVFLVIGVVLANTRFENFSCQVEDYSYYTNQDYTELVLKEESNEERPRSFSALQFDISTAETNFPCRYNSHKYANNAFNTSVLILHRSLVTNACYPLKTVTILQLYNNWHSSSEAEPPISDRPVLV